MNERFPNSSNEGIEHRFLSPEDRKIFEKAKFINEICLRASQVKDELIESGVNYEATIGIVPELWSEHYIEKNNCWIVTKHQSTHHKGGRLGVLDSHPYTFTTGYALTESGILIEYETDETIDQNPRLYHVLGKQSGEIIKEDPVDPEFYLDNGILQGLNELNDRAKIATTK